MKCKKKRQKRHGFTLIEILAAVTILGILSVVAVVSVNKIIEKSKQKHYAAAEQQMKNAGQEYVRNNRKELPRQIGEKNKIFLKDLVNKRYIETVKDYSDNDCNLEKSYVQVYKYSQNDYSYYAHLVCNKYDTSEEHPEKPVINISFDLPSNKKYVTKFSINDSNALISYSYAIYRYGEEKYNSGNISLNPKDKKKSLSKEKEIADLTPGKIKVVVTATNILGNTTMESVTKDFADNKPPKCIISKEDIQPKPWEKLDKRVITIGCDDEEGSGCKREKYTKEFEGTQDYGYITISDKAGNKTKCKVSVFIDTTAPVCVSSGGSDSWKNKDVTITGTCSDKGSGCKEPKVSKTFTSNIDIEESPGYLEDRVGNKIYCPSQRVRLDKIKPTMPRLTNNSNSNWTNQNVEISGQAQDEFSGIKKVYYQYEDGKKHTDWDEKETSNLTYTYKGIWGAERNNHVNVVVEDNAGNKSVYDAGYVRIDKTRPTISYKKSRNNWSSSASFTITATADDKSNPVINSGIAQIYYNVGNGNKTDWNTNNKHIATKTWYSEVNDEIKVFAVDKAGNYSQIVSAGHVLIDTTPPICTSSGGSNSWRNKNFKIYGHCTDGNGSGCKQATISRDITSDINGNESPGYVYDNAGNKTWCPNQVVKLDKTPPSMPQLVNNSNSRWTNQDVVISGKAEDFLSGIKKVYYEYGDNIERTDWDEKNNYNSSYTYKGIWRAERNNHVNVVVEDNAGNKSVHDAGQIKIDKAAPTIEFRRSRDSWSSSSAFTITAIANDKNNPAANSGIANIYYNVGSGNKTDWNTNDKHTATKTWNSEVRDEVKIFAVDKAGNYSQTISAGRVLIDTTAPQCTSSGGSNSWRNNNFTIYGKCTDTNGSGCAKDTIQKTISSDINGNESPGYVYDNAGNKTWCSNQVVKLDKTAPKQASISLSKNEVQKNETITATIGHDDSLSGINIQNSRWVMTQSSNLIGLNSSLYSGGNFTTNNQTITLDTRTPGKYYLHILSVDNVGNMRETVSREIQIKDDKPIILKPDVPSSYWYVETNSSEGASYSYHDGNWSIYLVQGDGYGYVSATRRIVINNPKYNRIEVGGISTGKGWSCSANVKINNELVSGSTVTKAVLPGQQIYVDLNTYTEQNNFSKVSIKYIKLYSVNDGSVTTEYKDKIIYNSSVSSPNWSAETINVDGANNYQYKGSWSLYVSQLGGHGYALATRRIRIKNVNGANRIQVNAITSYAGWSCSAGIKVNGVSIPTDKPWATATIPTSGDVVIDLTAYVEQNNSAQVAINEVILYKA